MREASLTSKILAVLAVGAALVAGGCSARGDHAGKQGKAATAPEVGYVVLQRQTVPLTLELAGRTTAFEVSEVRPQVSGIVQARLFTEGAMVKAGEVLYRIDPRIYQAALEQARADLASAVATRDAARAKADRFAELARTGVVSKQDLLDAQATAGAAVAAAERARAAVDAAQINLQFTDVSAPISGRIGRSIVTTGALVSAGQAEALTTIQRLDPIFVDIQQPSATLLALRRQLQGGDLARASTEVRLILEDGSRYSEPGVLQFAESVVDINTGTVTLRARFPNPHGLLLPGMFVRAQFTPVQQPDAILAPQQGISRDARGNATALVVGPDSRVQLRSVTADRTVGADWLVTRGLQPGDRLIIDGLSRAQPGQSVTPVPARPGAPAAAPAAPRPAAAPGSG
ncbi:MAG TPA: efflux RND transporter periplasmic adaptor subunit [Steroidobacteraceae bacterium]|nr:efflux RND transporter periplasmic adaptor subunit [Steroidobacteraceae bacterium]